jgi:phage terminase large subunit GpA-like protein
MGTEPMPQLTPPGNPSGNPLSKYFRQPAIYMALPSQGKWWAEGSLDIPATGELPVYPMTSKDEVIIRTPDALINGQGMVEVIQSCCPNIKDAWKMPAVDVDTTLIAIRIASYGHMMDFESKCPHCGEDNTFSMDLRAMLDKISCPDYEHAYQTTQFLIQFRPQAYFGQNRANKINFEVQKLGQYIDSMQSSDEKSDHVTAQMNRLLDLNLEILAECTEWIAPVDDLNLQVADKEFIVEFYKNAGGKIVSEIQERLAEVAEAGKVPSQPVKCQNPECGKGIDMNVVFDYTNFFGNGS